MPPPNLGVRIAGALAVGAGYPGKRTERTAAGEDQPLREQVQTQATRPA